MSLVEDTNPTAIAPSAAMRAALTRFRWVALAEGTSFAFLLCVGMPLKYVWGMRVATRILGSIHGVLTLAFLSALVVVQDECEWSRRRTLTAFISSLLPFGTFFFDRALRRELAALTSLDRIALLHSSPRPRA